MLAPEVERLGPAPELVGLEEGSTVRSVAGEVSTRRGGRKTTLQVQRPCGQKGAQTEGGEWGQEAPRRPY